jgi:anhydro-N-acetylmuramic acid kinase
MGWEPAAKSEHLAIGIMSGTSVDGIDAALVRLSGEGFSTTLELVAFETLRYTPAVRGRILAAQGAGAGSVRELTLLNAYLGELFAHAALNLCRKAAIDPSTVDVVGSHGQTLYHHPTPERLPGFTVRGSMQIGSPAVIAERTGITVVSDFRARDLAASGQGAPLAPFLDYLLYRHQARGRIVLNLGGIANLTALPPACTLDEVIAFDTGPANCLMDLAAHRASGGRATCDQDGLMAASGKVNAPLLQRLLKHPFLALKPPRSADKDAFGAEFLDAALAGTDPVSNADLLATLMAFTVETIASSVLEHVIQRGHYEEVIASGGGCANPVLMAGLRAALPKLVITTTDDYGLPSKAKEAVLMAVLARETLMGRPSNVPSATGARAPLVLGSITPGRVNGSPAG